MIMCSESCVYIGDICTSKDVPTCSTAHDDCNTFDKPFDTQFSKLFPKAYAEVCVLKSSQEQCLYTDIVYETCGETSGELQILEF